MRHIIAALLLLALTAAAADKTAHPNIVIFLADDQGWGDLRINGNKDLNTPNIDSLAREGVRFDRFYVCPVCAPTRAEFLTGRYYARTGVTGVSTGMERINHDEYTIGEVFKKAGYATGAFGKWHNGTQYPNHPNARGFDEYYGFTSGHWGHYFSPMLDHNGKIVKGSGYIVNDLTDKAMEFIDKQAKAGKPFFAYLPYCIPHSPMQVPDKFWDRFKDKKLEMRNRDPKKERPSHKRAALAMVENIDWNVGRVLKKLESLELTQNTIVLYFSDNGPNGWRWNDDMLGKKGSIEEGGLRSPLHIRWPGHLPEGRTVKTIAGAIDLLPTLTDLAGVKLDRPKPLDGVSLVPLLTDKADGWPERKVFSTMRDRVSVRTDRFRLSHNGKLFDMTKDPGQRKDISKQQPEIHKQLQNEVEKWKAEVWPNGYKPPDRPFVIGYGDCEETQLPVRDAKSSGGIKRSSRHPNCSYFTDWKDTNDRITWNADVDSPGTYEAILYYTCPKDDIGAKLELALGDNSVTGKVTKPHDPPLIGREENRSPSGESLVKDFIPMTLGRIRLAKGKGTLTLRALEIPGSQAMDFRLLILKRVD